MAELNRRSVCERFESHIAQADRRVGLHRLCCAVVFLALRAAGDRRGSVERGIPLVRHDPP